MSFDPYYATIIIGIVQLMGCSSGIILMKTVCRRGLLLVSTAFCCLTMASLAICIHMKWNWGSLVSLILFTFSHTTGLSPIPWILLGEIPTGENSIPLYSSFLCTYLDLWETGWRLLARPKQRITPVKVTLRSSSLSLNSNTESEIATEPAQRVFVETFLRQCFFLLLFLSTLSQKWPSTLSSQHACRR